MFSAIDITFLFAHKSTRSASEAASHSYQFKFEREEIVRTTKRRAMFLLQYPYVYYCMENPFLAIYKIN